MKRLVLIIILCSVMLFGCGKNEAPSDENKVTSSDKITDEKKGNENSEVKDSEVKDSEAKDTEEKDTEVASVTPVDEKKDITDPEKSNSDVVNIKDDAGKNDGEKDETNEEPVQTENKIELKNGQIVKFGTYEQNGNMSPSLRE